MTMVSTIRQVKQREQISAQAPALEVSASFYISGRNSKDV